MYAWTENSETEKHRTEQPYSSSIDETSDSPSEAVTMAAGTEGDNQMKTTDSPTVMFPMWSRAMRPWLGNKENLNFYCPSLCQHFELSACM